MRKIWVAGLLVLTLTACEKDKDKETLSTPEVTQEGVYVLNEGNFMANNASISYVDASLNVTADPYMDANGVTLGDVLQSFCVANDRGFAVLNNSNKVEIFNVSNFENVATISPVDYPRYIIDGENGSLYLTAGAMAGQVHVINPSSMTITSSINVGNGPERMVVSGENLFVCNSGGWSIDNTVSVINVLTNTVTDTWTLADRPIDIDVDANGDIWVLCSGETLYDADWNVIGHSDARLFRLSGDDYSVELDQVIGENGDHPRMMEVSADGQSVYFVNGNVYKAAIEESAFTPTVFISGDVNSLDVRANGEVWVSSVSDFVNPSTVMQYNAAGTLLNTLTAGMGSNGVVFP